MTFLSVIIPKPQIYLRTMLHAIGHAQSDGEMRDNLRLIAAILLAEWVSDCNPFLNNASSQIFDMVTSAHFYEKGYAKSIFGGDVRMWFCSYVGFEKVTSQWAKENHPDCRGTISMRLFNQDDRHIELDAHSIQIYF